MRKYEIGIEKIFAGGTRPNHLENQALQPVLELIVAIHSKFTPFKCHMSILSYVIVIKQIKKVCKGFLTNRNTMYTQIKMKYTKYFQTSHEENMPTTYQVLNTIKL